MHSPHLVSCVDPKESDSAQKQLPVRIIDKYVWVQVPGALHADDGGWVLAHRLIKAMQLGIVLPSQTHVHHRDCNPGNNALENLLTCPTPELHDHIHEAINELERGPYGRRDEARRRLAAAEEMCRKYEADIQAGIAKHFASIVDPQVNTSTPRIWPETASREDVDAYMATLSKSVSSHISTKVLRLSGGTSRGKPVMLERDGVPWSQQDTVLLEVLHTSKATLRVAAAIVGRSPSSVQATYKAKTGKTFPEA